MGLRTTDITDMPIYSIDIDIIDYCREHRLSLHDVNNSRMTWSTTIGDTQRKMLKNRKEKGTNKRQQEMARNKIRVCLPFPSNSVIILLVLCE